MLSCPHCGLHLEKGSLDAEDFTYFWKCDSCQKEFKLEQLKQRINVV